jgi:hypothetical protein
MLIVSFPDGNAAAIPSHIHAFVFPGMIMPKLYCRLFQLDAGSGPA